VAAFHVLFFDDAAVMRRCGANADAISIENLVTVCADIDDSGVGIAHDVDARRADEATAVPGMPDRRRKSRQVNIAVAQNIFLNRATFDCCRRNWLKAFQQFAPEPEQPIMRASAGSKPKVTAWRRRDPMLLTSTR
jgi:hypothetical protein